MRLVILYMTFALCLWAGNAYAGAKITYLNCTTTSKDGKTYQNEYVLNEANGTVSRGTFTTRATFGARDVSWSQSSGDSSSALGISFVSRYKISRVDLSFEEIFITLDRGDPRLGLLPSTKEETTKGTCKLVTPPKKTKF